MATIPIYDGPQVQERAMPDISVNPRARPDGAGMVRARQWQTLGEIGQQFALDDLKKRQAAEDRADADTVFGLSAELKKEVIGYEREYRKTRQGENAKGMTEDADKFFGEIEKKYSERLTNDRQRRLFARQFEQQRLSTHDGAARWQDQELDRSLSEKWAANKALTVERTVNDPTPDNVTAAVSEINAANQFAAANGKHGAEWLAAQTLKDTTTLHTSVISSMVERDPARAREYFEAHKDQIAGSQHEKITKAIRTSGLDSATQAYAAGVLASGASLEQAIAQTREKYAGQDEDAYVARVKEFYGERKAMETKQAEDLYDQAVRIVNDSGTYKSIPNSLITKLNDVDPVKANALLRARKKEADNLVTGGKPTPKTDDYDVLALAEDAIEAGDITNTNQLKQFAPHLRPATLNSLRKQLEKREEVPVSVVKRAFEDRGRKVREDGVATDEWRAFKDYIYEQVRETKRPEDVEAWADRWFMKGYGVNDSVISKDPGYFTEPSYYGESRMRGRTDFVADLTKEKADAANIALAALRKSGADLGMSYTDANGKKADGIPENPSGDLRASFYTKFGLEAERWAKAHNRGVDPLTLAAFANLRARGLRVTPGSVDQMRAEILKDNQ